MTTASSGRRPSRPSGFRWCRSIIRNRRRCSDAADRLYAEFGAAGIDVLLDDRDARPGVKFADSELIGIPHRLVIGERGLGTGHLEYRHRRDSAAVQVALADALDHVLRNADR